MTDATAHAAGPRRARDAHATDPHAGPDDGHLHGHDHGDHHGDAAAHGSLKGYATGFVLSVILTAIPFAIVMTGALAAQTAALVVLGFAAVQIVVHMVYFLHMDTKSEGGWTMMALIFTVLMVAIAFSGSVWVMYHLDTNMMPMTPDMMSRMQ